MELGEGGKTDEETQWQIIGTILVLATDLSIIVEGHDISALGWRL